MITSPLVITPDNRPRPLDVFGTAVTVLGFASQMGEYGITYQEGPEGSGPPPHSHDWDEAFFVLSGEVRFLCGEQKQVCPAGTLVHIPKHTTHGFAYCAGGGSMLEFTSRESKSAEMFTDIDAEIDSEHPDIQKALEVLARYGLKVSPP
jgi:mannose-6-phosphate isomerase-like protein (cupin superfamily)